MRKRAIQLAHPLSVFINKKNAHHTLWNIYIYILSVATTRLVCLFFTDPFDYFLLDDDTGELRTAKPLDREALENSTGVLTLIVKARELIDGMPGNDKLTVSTAEATVTIKDVNDEPPTFNRREYNIEIPENVPDGTPLPHLDMTVKDPDVVSVVRRFISAP